jgi:RNA polymerase sigma factor for flagellar operon FliA
MIAEALAVQSRKIKAQRLRSQGDDSTETTEVGPGTWELGSDAAGKGRAPKAAELWHRYAAAGPGSATENDLVLRYLPLVKTVVGRLAMNLPSHVDQEDLHSAGLVGLLEAMRRYDPACGTSFETFARIRIRGAVLDELRRMDWAPRSVHRKARRVEEAMRTLEQRHGKIPTDVEMAKELGLSLDAYQQLLEEIRPATYVCLDSVRSADAEHSSTYYEAMADERQEDPCRRTGDLELIRCIAERLAQLPENQRKVLALYYFEDLRLREIAEAFGVTESRISQIHAQAILAIKAALQRRDPLLGDDCRQSRRPSDPRPGRPAGASRPGSPAARPLPASP